MAGCIFKSIKKKIDKDDNETYFVSFDFVAQTLDDALEVKKEIEKEYKENHE